MVIEKEEIIMPKYTFLLPAFKSKYFGQALNSIKNQTLKDFCVLVSDDCSPEPLKEIFDEICSCDARFIYRRNEENMGGKNLVSHWNLLVNICNTEFLILASDDDIYEPVFLEEIDRLVQKYPEVDLFRARTSRIDEVGEPFEYDTFRKERQDSLEFLFDSYNTNHIHCIANYVFRKCRLQSVDCFVSFPLAWFSDDATVCLCCSNGVVNSLDVLFCFRDSQLNISNQRNLSRGICEKKIDATTAFYDFFVEWFQSMNYATDKYHRHMAEMVRSGVRARIQYQIDTYRFSIGFSHKRRLYSWLITNHFIEGKYKRMLYWLDYLRL